MSIEQSLIAYLKADTGITTLIGARIYQMHAPDKVTFPFLLFQRVSTARELSHDLTQTTLASPRFQFDVYARKISDGIAIKKALRSAMQGYRGKMGNIDIQAVLPVLEHDTDEPDLDYYRMTVDYKISYTEE